MCVFLSLWRTGKGRGAGTYVYCTEYLMDRTHVRRCSYHIAYEAPWRHLRVFRLCGPARGPARRERKEKDKLELRAEVCYPLLLLPYARGRAGGGTLDHGLVVILANVLYVFCTTSSALHLARGRHTRRWLACLLVCLDGTSRPCNNNPWTTDRLVTARSYEGSRETLTYLHPA